MIWNIPNTVTLVRVFIIPLFVAVFLWDWKWAREMAAVLFLIAAISDWFDGYLARKLQQSSAFGAFLDPVADKLIVATALILVTHAYASVWITIPAVVIMIREIFVSALREWMGQLGTTNVVKVNFIGKLKTTIQMIALVGLISGLQNFMGMPVHFVTLGIWLLWTSAVLSVWSMMVYTLAAWKALEKQNIV